MLNSRTRSWCFSTLMSSMGFLSLSWVTWHTRFSIPFTLTLRSFSPFLFMRWKASSGPKVILAFLLALWCSHSFTYILSMGLPSLASHLVLIFLRRLFIILTTP